MVPFTSWRRKWQPSPVFLPGESHGQRSLVGYSARGRKESDMTERLHSKYKKSQRRWRKQMFRKYLNLQFEKEADTCQNLSLHVWMLRVAFCSDMYRGRESLCHTRTYQAVCQSLEMLLPPWLLPTEHQSATDPADRKCYKPHMLPN